MIKIKWQVVILMLVLGAILTGVGLSLGAKTSMYLDGTGVHLVDLQKKTITQEASFSSVLVNAKNIRLEVIPSEVSKFEITYTGTTPVWSMENGVLNVAQEENWSHWFNFNFNFTNQDVIKIYAPQTVEIVDVKNDNGSINIAGINALAIKVANDNGGVNLNNLVAETIVAQNEQGGVKATNIKAAALNTENKNGMVILENIAAEKTTMKNENGMLHVDNIVTTGFNAFNRNGSIKVHGDLSGQTNIENQNGSIKLEVKDKEQYFELRNNNGSIRFLKEREHGVILKGNADAPNKIFAKNDNGTISVDLWID